MRMRSTLREGGFIPQSCSQFLRISLPGRCCCLCCSEVLLSGGSRSSIRRLEFGQTMKTGLLMVQLTLNAGCEDSCPLLEQQSSKKWRLKWFKTSIKKIGQKIFFLFCTKFCCFCLCLSWMPVRSVTLFSACTWNICSMIFVRELRFKRLLVRFSKCNGVIYLWLLMLFCHFMAWKMRRPGFFMFFHVLPALTLCWLMGANLWKWILKLYHIVCFSWMTF